MFQVELVWKETTKQRKREKSREEIKQGKLTWIQQTRQIRNRRYLIVIMFDRSICHPSCYELSKWHKNKLVYNCVFSPPHIPKINHPFTVNYWLIGRHCDFSNLFDQPSTLDSDFVYWFCRLPITRARYTILVYFRLRPFSPVVSFSGRTTGNKRNKLGKYAGIGE